METIDDELKNEWLVRLRRIHSGWSDGDMESSEKTADCVNKDLCLAIEIKKDSREYPNCPISFFAIRNQFKGFAQSANRKFRQYPNYKTCLMIQTPLCAEDGLLGKMFFGYRKIVEVQKTSATVSGVRDRYFSPKFEEIGAYIFYSKNFYFLPNPVAINSRKLDIEYAKRVLDLSKIEEVMVRGPEPFGV